MDQSQFFISAPPLHVKLNIGCLHDIPTGTYSFGKHGESILNGGLSYITGVGGRGNMGKSIYLHYQNLTVIDRYCSSMLNVYDTETSITRTRFTQLSVHLENIAGVDLEKEGRAFFTDNTVMSGNVWFDALRKLGDHRKKESKKYTLTTPFVNKKSGEYIQILNPFLGEIDSLSMFSTDSVENIYDKNQIGDSGANTDALRGAAAKSQMLMQLPSLTGQAGLYVSFTMHMGDQHSLDPYAPPQKQLAYLKGKTSFKHVPQKVTFLTNNLWYVMNAAPLQNKGTKAPEFPKDSTDTKEGDTDLQLLSVINLRAKNGPTGMPFELIVSQSEGVLVGLTEFWYLKSFDRYGLGGNDRTYYLELLPEVNLSRTTIRGKIDSDWKLRRALEITSEMCQLKYLCDDPEQLFITPKELYETLKAKGYDWNVLLDTRGYWVFEEHASKEKPFLSTMDLLRMAKNLYHPYWMKPL
jgi:hypothetical protein